MNALEWMLQHTQFTEVTKYDDCTVQSSRFTGRLNPRMRHDVIAAFEKLEAYNIGGVTRIYKDYKVEMKHDVNSGKTTFFFSKYI
jgi:hypothetical protein